MPDTHTAGRPPLLLLDLDRTLLNTDMFSAIVAHATRILTGHTTDPTEYLQSEPGRPVPNYQAFLCKAGIGRRQLEAAVRQEASRTCGLLYRDANPLLASLRGTETAILTFGNPDYQQLKLSCLPQLMRLPAHIVQQPKNEYIAERWPGRHGCLVDDKPDQNLPDQWGEINLRRGDTTIATMRRTGTRAVAISTLRNVHDAMIHLNTRCRHVSRMTQPVPA